VDSFHWEEEGSAPVNFANLLEMCARIEPSLRIRFSTSHPKDITDEVLHTMARFPNICKCIHLPVQAGNTEVLRRMNRTYTREWYMDKIRSIRTILPDCAITSDIIAGFCGETEAQHQDTLSIMEFSQYDFSYMFKYSERPGTLAARKYEDDIPEDVKSRRLSEIIEVQHRLSLASNQKDVGKVFEVLVEGPSKKTAEDHCGRNSQNKMVVFPKGNSKKGDYVQVLVESCTQATLIGRIV
jgi:tRNA-2-methylthio-N6-dimethylallyladenosine synthase